MKIINAVKATLAMLLFIAIIATSMMAMGGAF